MTTAPRRRGSRVGAVAALVTLLATACGGPPSKAEFVAKINDTIGSDLTVAARTLGVPADESRRLIRQFVDCQYESIRKDETLLQKTYDDPADVNISVALDTATTGCVEEFNAGIQAAADPSKATATTLPTVTVPEVTVPEVTVPPVLLPDTTPPSEDPVVDPSSPESTTAETAETLPETTEAP